MDKVRLCGYSTLLTNFLSRKKIFLRTMNFQKNNFEKNINMLGTVLTNYGGFNSKNEKTMRKKDKKRKKGEKKEPKGKKKDRES